MRLSVNGVSSVFRGFGNGLCRPAVRNGLIAAAGLFVLILVGSQGLRHFDPALSGYAFATEVAAFAVVYRYTVWLSKPSTRRFWKRGWQLLFSPGMLRDGRVLKVLTRASASRLVAQDFVWKRGKQRWIAHILIASGCLLAVAVTFPLVFGWIHFEQGAITPAPTYRVVFFGIQVAELAHEGLASWFAFHALVISSFLVIPGVILALHRRMNEPGEVATQRFVDDLVPLVLLFSVSFSGLLLWISYEWMEGYQYGALAQFHALTVIGTLIYIPFGKLFHVLMRPASLGIALYKAAGAAGPQARCPVTREEFASKMQVDDLKSILQESGLDYAPRETGNTVHWNQVSPKGKRMRIGAVHSSLRNGSFH